LISPLPDELIKQMQSKNIWQPDCPVPLERLSLVTIKFVDFENQIHEDGQLIVLDAVAPRVEQIFSTLFEQKFPIAKIKSLHHYDGDDDRSMADNNTSCFNYRRILGSKTVSMHGYGVAIDVNPLQNPYLTFEDDKPGIANIHPPAGWEFLNRKNQKPGMIEPIISIFESNGFTVWGGSWTTPIDYHHFQPPRIVAELATGMKPDDAARFFDLFASTHHVLVPLLAQQTAENLIAKYREDSASFFAQLPT